MKRRAEKKARKLSGTSIVALSRSNVRPGSFFPPKDLFTLAPRTVNIDFAHSLWNETIYGEISRGDSLIRPGFLTLGKRRERSALICQRDQSWDCEALQVFRSPLGVANLLGDIEGIKKQLA